MYETRLKEDPKKKLFSNSSHIKLGLLKCRKQNHWPGRGIQRQLSPPGKLRPKRTKMVIDQAPQEMGYSISHRRWDNSIFNHLKQHMSLKQYWTLSDQYNTRKDLYLQIGLILSATEAFSHLLVRQDMTDKYSLNQNVLHT